MCLLPGLDLAPWTEFCQPFHRYSGKVSLQLNLAALTEGELLSLFGAQELQRRLPEISRARLEGHALPGPAIPAVAIPTVLPGEPAPDQPGQLWGATPEQSRALSVLEAELLNLGAERGNVYRLPGDDLLIRAYTLGDVALAVHWNEGQGTARTVQPRLRLLTWLRDRASGLACVLTTDAQTQPVPSPSEEMDVHQHPGASPADLLKLHQQYVLRLGRAQKLPEGGWLAVWQAAHDLNLTAWERRGAVIATD